MVFGTAVTTTLISYIWNDKVPLAEILYLLIMIAGMAVLGFAGGFVWGAYLAAVSYIWGDEANNAFGAMRLNSYRHFIRLKIEKDKLTIFPIGVDAVPSRAGWMINPELDNEAPSQDTPVVVPVTPLAEHFIEEPIQVDLSKVETLDDLAN
jgi:hypothetical protein